LEGYSLADIALVVRQRASYGDTIGRVMREEALPCNLESRIEANDIPSLRAAIKRLIFSRAFRDETSAPKLSRLADLIKSEYSGWAMRIWKLFRSASMPSMPTCCPITSVCRCRPNQTSESKTELDQLSVVIASTLGRRLAGKHVRLRGQRVARGRLAKPRCETDQGMPDAAATKELLNIDSGEQARDPDEADQIENAETAKVEEKDVEKKRRPSRDIHPAAIAWATLVVERFSSHIRAVPRAGKATELRLA